METKYVWGDEEMNSQLMAIANAKNENEMETAIRGYMKDICAIWWEGLPEETKQAIRLVNFNHAVICSLMFFSPENFMISYYHPIRSALNDMVEAHANLITKEYPYDHCPIMPQDEKHHKYFRGTSEHAVEAAYYLNRTKKQLTEEMQGFARMYGIDDTRNVINTAIKKSSIIQNHKKNKAKFISELRKQYLNEMFTFLREYDENKGE